MIRLLKLIEENPNMSLEDIAVYLNVETSEVAIKLDELKANGTILGQKTIINWENVSEYGTVKSYIFLNVRPQKDFGFDETAKRISMLQEVDTVQLMSGSYDLFVEISGESFQSIALFVAKKLSSIDSVLSTATHFVLKTYKKDSTLYLDNEEDKRVL